MSLQMTFLDVKLSIMSYIESRLFPFVFLATNQVIELGKNQVLGFMVGLHKSCHVAGCKWKSNNNFRRSTDVAMPPKLALNSL